MLEGHTLAASSSEAAGGGGDHEGGNIKQERGGSFRDACRSSHMAPKAPCLSYGRRHMLAHRIAGAFLDEYEGMIHEQKTYRMDDGAKRSMSITAV